MMEAQPVASTDLRRTSPLIGHYSILAAGTREVIEIVRIFLEIHCILLMEGWCGLFAKLIAVPVLGANAAKT